MNLPDEPLFLVVRQRHERIENDADHIAQTSFAGASLEKIEDVFQDGLKIIAFALRDERLHDDVEV